MRHESKLLITILFLMVIPVSGFAQLGGGGGSGTGLTLHSEAQSGDTSYFSPDGGNTVCGFNAALTLRDHAVVGVTTLGMSGNLFSDGNYYVNYSGPDGDGYLYFYENSSPTGASIKWDNTTNRFTLNQNAYTSGYYYGNTGLLSNGDVYTNFAPTAANSNVYFYEGGSTAGARLRYDTLANEFSFNQTLALKDLDIYTGGDAGGAYDSTDAPADGDVFTWNTGGTVDWQQPPGAQGGEVNVLGSAATIVGDSLNAGKDGLTLLVKDVISGDHLTATATDSTLELDVAISTALDMNDYNLDSVHMITAEDSIIFVMNGDSAVWTSSALDLGGNLVNGLGNLGGVTNILGNTGGILTIGNGSNDVILSGGADDARLGLNVADSAILTKYAIQLEIEDSLNEYQPLDATLTDIADGTIAENLVNTANPWADNEVADDITITHADSATDITDGSVDSADIAHESIGEVHLDANAAVDEYVLTYELSTNSFEWEAGAAELSYFTEADNTDTSVFTATSPNTRIGFDDTVTMMGNSIIEADEISTGGAASGTLTLTGATSGSAAITVADVAGTPSEIVLPTSDGSSGYQLTTDGSGVTSWAAPGSIAWPDVFANMSRTYFDTLADASGDSVIVKAADTAFALAAATGDATKMWIDANDTIRITVDGQNGTGDTLKMFHGDVNSVGVWRMVNDEGWNLLDDSTMYWIPPGTANDFEIMIAADTMIIRGNKGVVRIGNLTTADTIRVGNLDVAINIDVAGDIHGADSVHVDKYTDVSIDENDINWGTGAVQVSADDMPMDTLGAPTYVTLADWFRISQSASIITGGAVTQNTSDSTAIDVALGTGVVKTGNYDTAAPVFFDFDAASPVSVADETEVWAYVDYNSGTPLIATAVISSINFNTQIVMARIYRSGNHMHITPAGEHFANYSLHNSYRLFEIYNMHRGSGMVMANDSVNKVSITAGAYYMGHNRIATGVFESNDTDMKMFYLDGLGDFTEVDTASINDLHYDDGDGTRASLTTNRYNVFWAYMVADGDVHVYYDSVTVSGGYTLAGALARNTATRVDGITASSGILIAKIIVQDGAGITRITYPWTTTISGTVSSDHGDLGGLGDDDHTQYLMETEIDASSELAAIMDDETGSGLLTFATNPTFADSGHFVDDLSVGDDLWVTGTVTAANFTGSGSFTNITDSTQIDTSLAVDGHVYVSSTLNVGGTEVIPTYTYKFAVMDPNTTWDTDSLICFEPITAQAITVTRIDITCDTIPTTQPAMTLRFANNFIDKTTPTAIDVVTTTAGVTTITSGFDDATIPASNCIYLDMTAKPEAALKSITFKISYTID